MELNLKVTLRSSKINLIGFFRSSVSYSSYLYPTYRIGLYIWDRTYWSGDGFTYSQYEGGIRNMWIGRNMVLGYHESGPRAGSACDKHIVIIADYSRN